jgi:hypothetical protein
VGGCSGWGGTDKWRVEGGQVDRWVWGGWIDSRWVALVEGDVVKKWEGEGDRHQGGRGDRHEGGMVGRQEDVR